MHYLALDLGMTTGYAYEIDGEIKSGVLKLKGTKKAPRSYGASIYLLHERVRDFVFAVGGEGEQPVTICYEDVRRHMGTRAAHVYGALEGVVHLLAHEEAPQVTLRSYSVQQIKQHATGKCVAGKDEMLAAAQTRWPWCKTHDEADALWLLQLAVREQR